MAKKKTNNTSARIADAVPRASSGNYTRLFGDPDLGYLISQTQSAAIRAGFLLENIIASKAAPLPGGSLDRFVSECNDPASQYTGTWLCTKKMVSQSRFHIAGHEPDLIIFRLNKGRGKCYIVELKAGSYFDTKKSDGELETLQKVQEALSPDLPFITGFYLCAFHAPNRDEIIRGLKNRFDREHVMTGRELCEILEISYEDILGEETRCEKENVNYFTRAVTSNAKNKSYLIPEQEFYSDPEDDDWTNQGCEQA